MPCEGMSFEQGKYTNWTAAGEEQQLVKIHTKQGCGRVKNKSQISWTMALQLRQIPKMTLIWPGGHKTTQRLAGFESPWLKKSWFNNPNSYPRAPEGFIPAVLCLYPITFRKMELSFPILAKNPNPQRKPPQSWQREGKERKQCLKIWEIDSKLNQPSQGEVLNGMGGKKLSSLKHLWYKCYSF